MERFDVVVVGGGPAGSVAARTAAEDGAHTVLVEARGRADDPSACAGLVSPRTLAVLGASDACVLRRLRDVVFRAPGGTALRVRTTSDRAVVVDRSVLEAELLEKAGSAGVDVRRGVTATDWSDGVLQTETRAGSSAVTATILVGADGPRSGVARWAGLREGRRCLSASQAEVEVPPGDAVVDVFVGRGVAPGFFGWSIPAQEGRARVGLAVHPGAASDAHLDSLLESHFAGRRVLSRVQGEIPLPSAERVVGDGVLLVGDAAGHVKPLSGGGLYFGGLCARLAGRAAARAASDPAKRDDHLQRYASASRRLLDAETRFGAAAAAARDAIADPDWDRVLTLLNRPDLLALVSEHVDIDYLHRMVPRLLGHPRLWPLLAAVWSTTRGAPH